MRYMGDAWELMGDRVSPHRGASAPSCPSCRLRGREAVGEGEAGGQREVGGRTVGGQPGGQPEGSGRAAGGQREGSGRAAGAQLQLSGRWSLAFDEEAIKVCQLAELRGSKEGMHRWSVVQLYSRASLKSVVVRSRGEGCRASAAGAIRGNQTQSDAIRGAPWTA